MVSLRNLSLSEGRTCLPVFHPLMASSEFIDPECSQCHYHKHVLLYTEGSYDKTIILRLDRSCHRLASEIKPLASADM